MNEAELQKARDEELEACVEWLREREYYTPFNQLRTARRPKTPSLKAQALAELEQIPIAPESGVLVSSLDTIRRALELLPND